MNRLTRIAVILAIIATTIGCDRMTKRLAGDALMSTPRSYLGGTVKLEYGENAGGFLSLGADWPTAIRTVAFTWAVGVLLVGLAVITVGMKRDWWTTIGLSLFVAGGLSNWADRALNGHVVDFLVIGSGKVHTGIFNLADAAISAGVILLAAAGSIQRLLGMSRSAE